MISKLARTREYEYFAKQHSKRRTIWKLVGQSQLARLWWRSLWYCLSQLRHSRTSELDRFPDSGLNYFARFNAAESEKTADPRRDKYLIKGILRDARWALKFRWKSSRVRARTRSHSPLTQKHQIFFHPLSTSFPSISLSSSFFFHFSLSPSLNRSLAAVSLAETTRSFIVELPCARIHAFIQPNYRHRYQTDQKFFIPPARKFLIRSFRRGSNLLRAFHLWWSGKERNAEHQWSIWPESNFYSLFCKLLCKILCKNKMWCN